MEVFCPNIVVEKSTFVTSRIILGRNHILRFARYISTAINHTKEHTCDMQRDSL